MAIGGNWGMLSGRVVHAVVVKEKSQQRKEEKRREGR